MDISLNNFEYLCYRRDYEAAGRELIRLLRVLDENYGYLRGLDGWAQSAEARPILDEHLLVRLTSAISSLVADPEFTFSEQGLMQITHFQRWIAALFASSPFRNADHILRALGMDNMARTELSIPPKLMHKFQLFYLPESEVRLDWDMLWKFDKKMAARLAITLMSSRFLGTPAAHQKREMLLRWLPERLDEIDSLDDLPVGVLHDAYMFCSYADLSGKHDIKKPINTLIRRKLQSLGLFDTKRQAERPAGATKPVAVVVLEWFSKNHSIYRTHSLTMSAMRERFHVVGMGYESRVDEVGRAIFDEFVPITGGNSWADASQIRELCEARDAQVMYMPSVGMFPITMVMACLRVAPLQVMALGHPATTHGHAIDYVVVEEDYVGDERCFSEKLLKLPSDGMPYRPPAAMLEMDLKPLPRTNNAVRIAVAATTIKLNPRFFEMCGRIARESNVPVEFHFLVGQAIGLMRPQLQNLVRRIMGDSGIVYGHQDYDAYMNVIAGCDLFMNPFPFGNTNGIVDTVWAGLMGVCKTGPEVNEHIDEAMFRRLGFPEWMIARNDEEYFSAVKRLVENPQERSVLAKKLAGPQAIQKLIFEGRPSILGQRLDALWQQLHEVRHA